VMEGCGHGIAEDGLAATLAFLQKTLPHQPVENFAA
jgi:hypothetical protein